MALTDKQRRFVDEYLVDLNATQAAIRAGYSQKTASSQGERLLRNVEVSRAVQEAQAKRSTRVQADADYVLRRLVEIDQMDVLDIMRDDMSLTRARTAPGTRLISKCFYNWRPLMATCKNQKYVGRDVVLEYHIGCGDQLPAETDWKRFAALRTKEFTLEWETADATADDSVGALRENIATFQTLSISGDGTAKASGAGSENLIEITKHVARPDATGGQPVAWMRMTFPDLTFTAFMLVSNMSRSAPFDDVVTFSLEASATGSDFGLIVEDTPNPDAADPTSVEVIPSTLSLTVGQTFDAEAVVLPVGASQSLRWTSSNPSMATVNQVTGQIAAIAAGSVTITAASSAAPSVTDTVALTVVPLVQGITVSPTAVSVEEGATQALTASVSPSGAAPGLVYESAAPAVATVSNVGLVTGVAEGTTSVKITSAARPAVSVTVPVTVTAP